MNEYRAVQLFELALLLPMAQSFFTSAGEYGEFNPNQFISFWGRLYASGNGVVFAEFEEGKPIAMLGVISGQDMGSGAGFIEECFWYADQSHKTSASKLIQLAEDLGRQIGAKVFYLHHQAEHQAERLSVLFKRKGFDLKFLRYCKEL